MNKSKKKQVTLDDVKKERIASIWDDDVDMYKVEKLSPKDKHRLFPNDYAPDGTEYGDF